MSSYLTLAIRAIVNYVNVLPFLQKLISQISKYTYRFSSNRNNIMPEYQYNPPHYKQSPVCEVVY